MIYKHQQILPILRRLHFTIPVIWFSQVATYTLLNASRKFCRTQKMHDKLLLWSPCTKATNYRLSTEVYPVYWDQIIVEHLQWWTLCVNEDIYSQMAISCRRWTSILQAIPAARRATMQRRWERERAPHTCNILVDNSTVFTFYGQQPIHQFICLMNATYLHASIFLLQTLFINSETYVSSTKQG